MSKIPRIFISALAIFFLTTTSFFSFFPTAYAADANTIQTLRQNIDARNAQITELNAQIKSLDAQIQAASKEGQTLKGAISELEANKAKLNKEIEVTQNQVQAATLSIEKLGLEITDKQKMIDTSTAALAESLKDLNQAESTSLIETLFTYNSATDLWNEIDSLTSFQNGLRQNMVDIRNLKSELSQQKSESESQKNNLVGFKNDLVDKEQVVAINSAEKAKLLATTQDKESAYRKQLEDKKAQSEAFQKEINDYESQLKFILNPSSLPSVGSSVLSWPVQKVTITQYFGDTDFAKSTNAYNGKGHNGVDFGASIGTKVLAALSGTVEGVGNTDLVKGCYSYGKWILIKHDNGLASLYGHLSLIKVVAGQRVSTGDVIAYSGNTGYTTGPHLHFGVFASQGAQIITYQSNTPCNGATLPVAAYNAYLNPMLYLPS